MKTKMTIKEQLYNLCVAFVETRFQTIQQTINEIQQSLSTETKSSAGDKHETGRAMLQLEREKTGNQLAKIVKIKASLAKIDPSKSSPIIGLGSVVYTSQSSYFIAVSAGELQVNQDRFYAISPNTPIGKLLLGKTVADSISFRDQKFTIEKVF